MTGNTTATHGDRKCFVQTHIIIDVVSLDIINNSGKIGTEKLVFVIRFLATTKAFSHINVYILRNYNMNGWTRKSVMDLFFSFFGFCASIFF